MPPVFSKFSGFPPGSRVAHLYELTPRGIYRAPVTNVELTDPVIRELMSGPAYQSLLDEVELLDGAGAVFDTAAIGAGPSPSSLTRTPSRVSSSRSRRTWTRTRLSNAAQVFGRERETVDEAYDEIPRFPPECFGYLENADTATFKRFSNGVDQLLEEGVVQRFELPDSSRQRQLIGAVGPLQFEIVQYRLESEYGAKSRVAPAPWTVARWVDSELADGDLQLPGDSCLVRDDRGRRVALFANDWSLRFYRERGHLAGPRLDLLSFPAG